MTRFFPASALTLAAVADLYTRTFADYFYEAIVTAEDMARYMRVEQIVLGRSPVLCVGDEMVGLATVGVRDDAAFCKGFGVIVPYRGRGLASKLCDEVIRQARLAGARTLGLGVLQNNERAVRTYLRAGFRVRRDLVSFEWHKTREVSETSRVSITDAEPHDLLAHFAALHPVAPIWGRDLRSLSAMGTLRGLAIMTDGAPTAYALYERGDDGVAWVADIATVETLQSPRSEAERDATSLLHVLQQQCRRITCDNEPADSPLIAALRAAGFGETRRRYEMVLEV